MSARTGKQKCTVGSKRETGELGNASAAVTELSTTKHPLNNSVINSLARLRRPVPPPAQPLLSLYAPEAPRRLHEYERKELAVLAAFILRHYYSLPLPLYSSLPMFNAYAYSSSYAPTVVRFYLNFSTLSLNGL